MMEFKICFSTVDVEPNLVIANSILLFNILGGLPNSLKNSNITINNRLIFGSSKYSTDKLKSVFAAKSSSINNCHINFS